MANTPGAKKAIRKIALRPPIGLAGFAFDPTRLDAETRRDFTP